MTEEVIHMVKVVLPSNTTEDEFKSLVEHLRVINEGFFAHRRMDDVNELWFNKREQVPELMKRYIDKEASDNIIDRIMKGINDRNVEK